MFGRQTPEQLVPRQNSPGSDIYSGNESRSLNFGEPCVAVRDHRLMRCRRLGTLEIKPDIDALRKTDLPRMLGRILSVPCSQRVRRRPIRGGNVLNRHQGQPYIEDGSGLCLGQVSFRLHVLPGYVSNTKFESPCFRRLASAAMKHRVGIEPVYSRWRSENTSRQRHLASPVNTFRVLRRYQSDKDKG